MICAIFDLDGTLVDLFETHLKGFQHIVGEEYGMSFTAEDLARNYGKTCEVILEEYLIGLSRDYVTEDLHEIAERRRQWVQDNIGELTPLPGVLELLTGLQKDGILLALGTSNTETIGEVILDAASLNEFFKFKSYRGEGMRGKPAPDIFLNAAMGVGLEPKDCIVVEDSVHGIEAAKRASMKTVGVASGKHSLEKLKQVEADLTISSLTEIDVNDILELFKND
jgi:beta-phosphoglucomutase